MDGQEPELAGGAHSDGESAAADAAPHVPDPGAAGADAAVQESETVTILRDGDRTFYIVGTAHISDESVQEVNRIIEAVRPDVVAVELCEARHKALVEENRWRNLDIFKVIVEGKTLFLLANLAIGAYQRRLGHDLGVKPGAEMVAAMEKADAIGAELALVDRDIHTTLKRTWANVSFWRKVTLLGAIMDGLISKDRVEQVDIEALKQQANLAEMMKEFSRVMPEVQKPLIDERDQFLISSVEATQGKTVVVVVGAGHVPGMKRYFKQPVDREALAALPKPKRWVSALKWLIPAVVVLAFAYGYQKTEGQSLRQMLFAWVMPNSVVAAILTAAAGAKALSILTAFIASPITSLNPLLGAGMVVGLVEAWLRKPTVEDAENINRDVQSFRGIYKNPFTRVLLVVVASTLGSALGAWIGATWIVVLVSGS